MHATCHKNRSFSNKKTLPAAKRYRVTSEGRGIPRLPAGISSPTACSCHMAWVSNYSIADVFGTELEGSVKMQREPV